MFKFMTPVGTYSDIFIASDRVALNFMINGLCEYVIMTSDSLIKGNKSFPILRENLMIAEHGYTNHLIYCAHFLHQFTKELKQNKNLNFRMIDSENDLIKTALIKFKEWKDLAREKEVKEMGEHWASGTLYVQWDPCEFI